MNLHSHTPSLMVIDARGLSVGQVRFCRSDDLSVAEPRIVRQVFDLPGRLVSSFDSRLDLPHTSTIQALGGAALLSNSVDAGWQVNLSGASGRVLEAWDSRGNRTSISHDALLRPVAVVEQLEGQVAKTVERFTYGDTSNESAAHNQCGQLLRRDDPAGSTAFLAFGLTGACLRQQRRFLLELDQPDWPVAMSERDAWLETDNYVSSSVVGPLDDVIESSDAQGHRRLRHYGCDGQLKQMSVKLANAESTLTLVSDIRYNALGAVEQETAGNGVISTAVYDEGNGRLLKLRAQSDERAFQDLNYAYDPVGNVVSIEDAAQSTGHFSQQRTDPVNRYRYDSLYQLIEATGREVATFSHGPHLPSFQTLPLDPGRLINYTQRFDYDTGGNLIARHHSGTDTWRMATSTTSNRSVPQRADGSLPGDEQIEAEFDGNGNFIELQPGQIMRWDARNQLSDITSVVRDDGPNNGELYRYDGDGQRVRKVRYAQTRSRTLTGDVRYLPDLEIHRNDATAEVRHVLTVEAGRCTVRVLHWESGKPNDLANDQSRYSLSDHLGSSTLELDDAANLISYESYYPYGGTAWWVGRSAVEASYKTVRYSGKERDATGLYYYGFRYYAPWLQRWISPDPAGTLQSFNLYQFVGCSPVSSLERDGRVYEGMNDWVEFYEQERASEIRWRGLSEFDESSKRKVLNALRRANQAYADAHAMLVEYPEESGAVLRNYFGAGYKEVSDAVVSAWGKTNALVSAYQQHWGRDKIIGMKVNDPYHLAHVNIFDFHGRIMLNLDTLDRPDLSIILAHEVSHLGRVNRFARSVGPQTQDYFYLLPVSTDSLQSGPVNSFDVPEEGTSRDFMNGGATEAYLNANPDLIGPFVSKVAVLSGGAVINTLSEAVAVFNARPDISAAMASENADSLVFAAYSLHERYQLKQAARNLFKQVLHE